MNHARPEDDEEEERGHNQMTAITKKSETSHRHRVNENGTPANSGVHSTKGSQQFTIPTLHIEEADADTEMANLTEVPEIEISDVDENELRCQHADDQNNPETPLFIVQGEDGHPRIVYSFEEIPKLLEGILQTSI